MRIVNINYPETCLLSRKHETTFSVTNKFVAHSKHKSHDLQPSKTSKHHITKGKVPKTQEHITKKCCEKKNHKATRIEDIQKKKKKKQPKKITIIQPHIEVN